MSGKSRLRRDLCSLADYLDDQYQAAAASVVKMAEDSIAEYEHENAKLRQQLADAIESMGRVEKRCANLRELVRHMHECMSNVDADGNHECYSCEYENTEGECDFERLMRELGVEVEQ